MTRVSIYTVMWWIGFPLRVVLFAIAWVILSLTVGEEGGKEAKDLLRGRGKR